MILRFLEKATRGTRAFVVGLNGGPACDAVQSKLMVETGTTRLLYKRKMVEDLKPFVEGRCGFELGHIGRAGHGCNG